MKPYNRLREYVELDKNIIERDEISDFIRFCDQHCDDITDVCDCLDEIVGYIDRLDENDFEKYEEYCFVKSFLEPIKDIIKKVID